VALVALRVKLVALRVDWLLLRVPKLLPLHILLGAFTFMLPAHASHCIGNLQLDCTHFLCALHS
jgi:hypothetical protein